LESPHRELHRIPERGNTVTREETVLISTSGLQQAAGSCQRAVKEKGQATAANEGHVCSDVHDIIRIRSYVSPTVGRPRKTFLSVRRWGDALRSSSIAVNVSASYPKMLLEMSLHSVSATHQRSLNQLLSLSSVPKALVSREYGVDIDPNVL